MIRVKIERIVMIIEQKDQLRKQRLKKRASFLYVLPTYPNVLLYFKEERKKTKQNKTENWQMSQRRLRQQDCTLLLYSNSNLWRIAQQMPTLFLTLVKHCSNLQQKILPDFTRFSFLIQIPHYYFYSTSVIQWLSSQCV